MQIHEWIADRILASVKDEDQALFLDLLQNRREDLIALHHPHMEAELVRYTFTQAEAAEGVMLNTDHGDPDAYYTLAKRVIDHLRDALLTEGG